jgi:hypothetical protein
MTKPDPSQTIAPLIYSQVKIQGISDSDLLALEKDLEKKIAKADNLDNQRVNAVFELIAQEKNRRDL